MIPVFAFEAFLWLIFTYALCDGLRRFGWKKGLAFFLPLIIYGWVLEELAIAVFHRYAYSTGFLVTYRDAPFSIAAGWAAILYSGIIIAEGFSLNRGRAALFVALWGLSIDFSMDALAVFFGYWTWFPPADVILPYFNVPVSNFIGWFIILFSFTFFYLHGRDKKYRKFTLGFDAVMPSVPLLLLAIYIMLETEYERAFTSLHWWQMVLIFPVPLMVCLSLWIWKMKDLDHEHRTVLPVPEGFHFFFLASALSVWMRTGLWSYLAASAVSLLPLSVYLGKTLIPRRGNSL